jgi:hypothetical protein
LAQLPFQFAAPVIQVVPWIIKAVQTQYRHMERVTGKTPLPLIKMTSIIEPEDLTSDVLQLIRMDTQGNGVVGETPYPNLLPPSKPCSTKLVWLSLKPKICSNRWICTPCKKNWRKLNKKR